MRRLTAVLSVVVFAIPAVVSAQAPATFRVGLKDIAIPSPSAEFSETGSDYRVLLENLVPGSNRLVAAFLLPDELEKLRTSTTSLSSYAMVEVPRVAEFAEITPEMFKQIDASLGSQLGGDNMLKAQQDEVDHMLKEMGQGSTTITLDKPLLLGSLLSKPDVSTYGEIMQLQVNGTSKKMAVGITIFACGNAFWCSTSIGRTRTRTRSSGSVRPARSGPTRSWLQISRNLN